MDTYIPRFIAESRGKTAKVCYHIFPKAYCVKKEYKKEKWNSIVNKTPLLPESNRSIGGYAPSTYCKNIMKNAEIEERVLAKRVASHLIDYDYLITDNFALLAAGINANREKKYRLSSEALKRYLEICTPDDLAQLHLSCEQ